MPPSVFVAAIIGFIIGAITSFEGGLICGTFLGLIVWALTGFRFGNEPPAQTTSVAPGALPTRPPSDKNLTARDIGRGLAKSLTVSCALNGISETERSLAQAAKIPLATYYRERLLLSAFAQDHTIFRLIGRTDAGTEVRTGHREFLQDPNHFKLQGTDLLPLFGSRCRTYAQAVSEDELAPKDAGGLAISRLALAFGGHIQPPNASSAEIGTADMLAMVCVHSLYDAHVRVTTDIISSQNILG